MNTASDLHLLGRVGRHAHNHEPIGTDVDGLRRTGDFLGELVFHGRDHRGGRDRIGINGDRVDDDSLAVGVLERLANAGYAAGIRNWRTVSKSIRADVAGLD